MRVATVKNVLQTIPANIGIEAKFKIYKENFFKRRSSPED